MIARRLAAAAGAAAAVALAAAGCSSGQPGDITVAGQKVLAPKVQQVRDVAATGTYAQLVRVVNQLKRLVDTEVSDGQVSQSRANAIKDAADTLLTDARPAESTSPSASPTPSQTSASPTPSASTSASSSASPSPSPSGSSSPGTSITIGGSPP